MPISCENSSSFDETDMIINIDHELYPFYVLKNEGLSIELLDTAYEQYHLFKKNLENDRCAEIARTITSMLHAENYDWIAEVWQELADQAVTVKNNGRNHGMQRLFKL